jgi:hypothetical protein
MTQRIVVLMLGLVLSGAVVQSQSTHPCDQVAPTTLTVQSSGTYKVQFCAKPSDQPEAFTVYTNTVASDLRPLTLVVAANALGNALYEGPQELRFPRGTYQVELSLWNRQYAGGPTQEGAKSAPLSLTGVDDTPPAAAPVIMGIIR